jgi:mono/diheme cytochrome c family protein
MKYSAVSFIAILVVTSCDVPRRQAAESAPVRPSEVSDFRLLYSENCSGCHGANGEGALTVGIGRPVYLSIADDITIRHVVKEGRPGTAMPAFARKAGGLLTDAQIDILIRGIRSWGKPAALGGETPPAYAAIKTGDPMRGRNIFTASCSSCHGADGRGARAVADPSYLALVSDQHLRTVVITGMPHLGMPDWRSHAKPLSTRDVTDLVAWLAGQRESLSAQLRH